MLEKINIAQFGTKHGHAKDVLKVMLAHPEVKVVGVWEPDSYHQKKLEQILLTLVEFLHQNFLVY